MSLETGNYINDLVIANPTANDPKSQGDDHLRLLKTVIKESLNGFSGAILLTATDTGTASAHALTPSTALVGYTTGLMLLYRPANAGTGALTVNVSSLGAKSVKTIAGADPTSGDILASQPILLMYDGTNFVLLAGSEYLSKTGNQTLTGNLTLTGNQTVSGTLGVTGALSGTTGAFSGSVTGVTETAGDNSTKYATTAFATGLAFAAALPAQSGKTDYVVTTNGSVASWTNTLKDSVINFVNGSDTTKKLAFALSGITTGTTRTATFPDKDGTVAMLSDAVPPVFGSLGSANVTASADSLSSTAVCALSSTKAMTIYVNGSSFPQAAVLNSSGVVQYTAQIEAAAVTANTVSIVPLTSTTALAMWVGASNRPRVAVLTDTGAAVTIGTIISVEAVASALCAVALLSSTKVVTMYTDGTNTRACVVTISGTTATAGTPMTARAAAGTTVRITPLSSTVMVFITNSGGVGCVAGVLTESAGSLTVNTLATIYNAPTSNIGDGDVCAMSSSVVMCAMGAGASNAVAFTMTVSGTGAAAVLQLGRWVPIQSTTTTANRTRLIKLSSATALHMVVDPSASKNLSIMPIAMNGTGVIPGVGTNVARQAGAFDLAMLSSSTAIITYADQTNSNYPTAAALPMNTVV